MREAGAAQQESQRGNLRDSGDYQANASQRCTALPAAEKADCERRAKGEGSVSGSVGGGGVVRELVTPVPAGQQGSRAPQHVVLGKHDNSRGQHDSH